MLDYYLFSFFLQISYEKILKLIVLNENRHIPPKNFANFVNFSIFKFCQFFKYLFFSHHILSPSTYLSLSIFITITQYSLVLNILHFLKNFFAAKNEINIKYLYEKLYGSTNTKILLLLKIWHLEIAH